MKILIAFIVLFQYLLVQAQIAPEWYAYYNHPYGGNSQANAIAVDNDGNVYVTGMSDHAMNYTPITTIKYNSSGVQQWSRDYPSDGSGKESAGNSIATYTDGDNTYIYVAGRKNAPDPEDFVTIQYDASGTLRWARIYPHSGEGSNRAYHIDVDNEGNAYVTGERWNGNNSDYVTIKYDIDGYQLWDPPVIYHGGYGNDVAKSLDFAAGIVYVTGSSVGNGTSSDFATIAYYSSNGGQLWASPKRYSTANDDYGNDIAADTYYGVYVTGVSNQNYFTTIKYDNSDGTELWVRGPNTETIGVGKSIGLFRRPGSGNTYNYHIEAFVTGYTTSSRVNYGFTIGYHENGNVLSGWPQTNTDATQFVSLGLDPSENVYVTGEMGQYYLTVKYSSSGGEQWYAVYPDSGSTSYSHIAQAIAVDSDGNPCVTGYILTYNPYNMSALYLTLKYSSSGNFGPNMLQNPNANGKLISPEIPERYSLEQNYPNPFNPVTVIRYGIPKAGLVRISVYDILGEEITQLVNEYKEAGYYDTRFDGSNLSSGIYIYKISTPDFNDTRKMVLIK